MKVLPFKIPKQESEALVYKVDSVAVFYDKLHQHDEIQFSIIIEGKGTLIIGDSINDYKKGDILVIGSNLPHVFKSDDSLGIPSKMLSLFFTKRSFGEHFFDLEDLRELKSFFKRSTYGFKVESEKEKASHLFKQLERATKLERMILFLQLLQIGARCEYSSMSSFIYGKAYTAVEGKRMRDVFEYTMNNFNKSISLDEISNVANMTKNAFCKYFKKHTNKTYFTFVNELRIGHACKLIQEDNDLSMAEIAYDSGFRNISNFNRQFKALKKIRPTDYKRMA